MPDGQAELGAPQTISALLPQAGHGERDRKNAAPLRAEATQLWQVRWSRRKQPAKLALEAKPARTALARDDAGFVHRCRSMLRQLGHRFDPAHREAQAKCTLQPRRQAIHAVDDDPRHKLRPCFDEPWEQALR